MPITGLGREGTTLFTMDNAGVLRAIDIVTMFTSVFIITGGTPGGATETVSYFIYRNGFKRFDFGYAVAGGRPSRADRPDA